MLHSNSPGTGSGCRGSLLNDCLALPVPSSGGALNPSSVGLLEKAPFPLLTQERK